MEKNEFNELLDGIVECADKVAKLGRLLKEVLPQLAEQTTEAPTDVPAVEATPIFNSGILFIFYLTFLTSYSLFQIVMFSPFSPQTAPSIPASG